MCAKKIRFYGHPQLPFEEWEPSYVDQGKVNPGQSGYTDLDITPADLAADKVSERNLHFISLERLFAR